MAKLVLDLHDIYNRGDQIERELNRVIQEAVEKRIQLVEIIPGKGSGPSISGAIAVMLTAITVFFVSGGLALVRANEDMVPWFSWLFPHIYAIDPLRDLILFHQWPVDWFRTLLILAGFAVFGLIFGFFGGAARQIRGWDILKLYCQLPIVMVSSH